MAEQAARARSLSGPASRQTRLKILALLPTPTVWERATVGLSQGSQRQSFMTSTHPESIARFKVLKRLGKGSQGSVYLARDPNLDRLVAVKVIDSGVPELTLNSKGNAPLEGRISSRLKHPNIVSIFDAGEYSGGTFMVFEYVEGTTLKEKLSESGNLSIEEAAEIIAPILDAMASAHKNQIVHLDLNLRNILVDSDDVPRIMDFGLSQHVEHTPRNSTTATGTLRYMAPEHFSGYPLGTYTDVFALGSSFYELVTGKHARNGSSVVEVMRQIQTEDTDFTPLQSLASGDAFARFLAGALERDVDGRYADGATMRDAFNLFLKEAQLELNGTTKAVDHSTIEFLMRRMQRKQDFPSISNTLIEINRLTGEGAMASADKLAGVILRDFALTNKILKLANSAFYGARASEISSISQAIVLMGVDQLRMIANSLTLFGHLQGDGKSGALKDSMIRSLLSGMLARHLAREMRIRRAEEAFIFGMFHNLGENLSIYYFNEEYEDVRTAMRERRLTKSAAARGVLGVDFSDLGVAVSRIWQMPESLTAVIRGLPNGPRTKPESDDDKMRDIAIFSNELCSLHESGDGDRRDAALKDLLDKFQVSVPLSIDKALILLRAGFDKLQQSAEIFEINIPASEYCKDYMQWLDMPRAEPDEEQTQASAQTG